MNHLLVTTAFGRLLTSARQFASDISGPIACLQFVAVHQATGAALEQRSAEYTHIVLGAVGGMGIVAELLGAVEFAGAGRVGRVLVGIRAERSGGCGATRLGENGFCVCVWDGRIN